MTREINTCIVGAGPAGITAAIQLKRCGIPFVLLERKKVGGLLRNANLVENYPGFPEGISGPALVARFRRQMERLGVEVSHDEAVETGVGGEGFLLRTSGSENLIARNLVIATGTRPGKVDIPGMGGKMFDRIFHEVADLPDICDKEVVIIGGGDAAFDYALNLAGKNRVTILNRGGRTKCLPLLFKRAKESPGIRYLPDVSVSFIASSQDGLKLRADRQGQSTAVIADYLLFAVGRVPSAGLLSAELLDSWEGKIKIQGLYFIGDVARGITRQAAVAVGDGMACAMDIYLGERESR